MTDDSKVIPLQRPSRPREVTCTREAPGMPVHPRKRSSDLRSASEDMDGEALHRLGFGKGVPHSGRRPSESELREMRDRSLAMAKSAGTREQCHRQMAEADMLERVELESLAKWLSEQIGDDDPKGAA